MRNNPDPFRAAPFAEVAPATVAQQIQSRVETISRHLMLSRVCQSITFRAFGTFRDKFHNWAGFQKTLGVSLHGKFLKELEVLGKRDGVIQTSFVLQIDWERHEVLSKTAGAGSFVVRKNRSIESQIDKAMFDLIAFLRKRVRAGAVDNFYPIYTWISGSEAEQKEWRKLAGTSPLSDNDRSDYQAFYSKAYGLDFKPDKLKELTVSIRSK